MFLCFNVLIYAQHYCMKLNKMKNRIGVSDGGRFDVINILVVRCYKYTILSLNEYEKEEFKISDYFR